jgi:hypothetical protein
VRFILAIIVLLFPALAAAQSPPSASEQACNLKLGSEINGGLQLSAALIASHEQLVKAQARVKELEDKYEAKKPDAPAAK